MIVRQLWHPSRNVGRDGKPLLYPELYAACDGCSQTARWEPAVPPDEDPRGWWAQRPGWQWWCDAEGAARFLCPGCWTDAA